jgi:hypothetical protein
MVEFCRADMAIPIAETALNRSTGSHLEIRFGSSRIGAADSARDA